MDPREVLKNVVDLSMSAVEVSVSTAHILSGTGEVQSAATSMASAVEELAASIAEIERAAQRSSEAMQRSSHLTQEGMKEMGDLRSEMIETGKVFETVAVKTKDLQGVVSSLGQVVDLISKIAGQTNLLALNATIEAARAGEMGKGFAVVAGEVKSLSRQTREATDTIRTQIGQLNESFSEVLGSVAAVQTTVKGAVVKTERVANGFGEINDNAQTTTSQVADLVDIIGQQKIAVQLLAENMSVVKDKGDVNLRAVGTLSDQTDQSVKLIEAWRANLANEDIEDKVIYLAQADHLLWKKRLLDMAVGRSQLKASELTDHTLCRLGKWYYGQADERMKDMPSFAAIEEPHQRVHAHGIEAAKLFERGNIAEGMQQYDMVESASRAVIEGLQALLSAARTA